MTTSWFWRFFNIDDGRTITERAQAKLIIIVSLLIFTFYMLFFLFVPISSVDTRPLVQNYAAAPITVLSAAALPFLTLFTLFAVRHRASIAAWMPIIIWLTTGVVISFYTGFSRAEHGMALTLLILFSGLFLYERGVLISTVVAVILLLVRYVLGTTGLLTGNAALSTVWANALMLIGNAIIIRAFLRLGALGRVEGAAAGVEQRLRQATLSTEIAGRVSSRRGLDDVLTTAVTMIRDNYPEIYHAQIFLVDETRERAHLAASTGEAGQKLLALKHNLPVGSLSVIGRVTNSGEIVIARAGASDSVHRRNEFLPDTVVEAAFPLRVAGRVIGALDLQSKVAGTFLESEQPIFQSLADNLAVAIDNTQLLTTVQKQLGENERLMERTQSTMHEVETLNRQLTRQSWTDYLRERETTVNLDYDVASDAARVNSQWTDPLREAVAQGALVQGQSEAEVSVSVPLRVRGEVVGALEFMLAEAPAPEDITLIEMVLERLGGAIENARLYADVQSATYQEQRVNTIAGQYSSVSTLDDLFRITLSELGETLGARSSHIQMMPVAENAPQDGDRQPVSAGAAQGE